MEVYAAHKPEITFNVIRMKQHHIKFGTDYTVVSFHSWCTASVQHQRVKGQSWGKCPLIAKIFVPYRILGLLNQTAESEFWSKAHK